MKNQNFPSKQTTYTTNPTSKAPASKNKRVFWLVISLIVLLLVFFYLVGARTKQYDKSKQSNLSPSLQATQPEPESADKLLRVALAQAGVQNASIDTNGMSIYRTVEGYEFKVPTDPKGTYAAMIQVSGDEYASKKNSLEQYFKSLAYKQVDAGASGAGRSINFDGQNYSCNLDEWGIATVQGKGMQRSIIVLCASAKGIAQEAEKLQPLYTLLRSDPTVEKDSIKMLPIIEKPTKAPGYVRFDGTSVKRAGSRAKAVFYRSSTGPWQVVYSAPGGFMCTEITTNDARKAFAGEKCFESDGKTTRQL